MKKSISMLWTMQGKKILLWKKNSTMTLTRKSTAIKTKREVIGAMKNSWNFRIWESSMLMTKSGGNKKMKSKLLRNCH